MFQDPTHRMSAARTYTLMKHPFFGTIGIMARLKQDDSIPTLCTDGRTIWYSSRFMKTLSAELLRSAYLHELLHIIMKHHLRRKSREGKRWNKACDYAVNLILKSSGFQIGEGWLIDSRYEGLSAEQIYEMLPESQGQGGQQPGQGSGQGRQQPGQGEQAGDDSQDFMPGEIIDATNPDGSKMSEAQITVAESDLNASITMAATVAKKMGKLPAGIEALIGEWTQCKTDWVTLLSRFVDAYAKNDYSYRKLSRSAMQRGFVSPSLSSEELGEALVIMDLSGSIGQEERNQELGEIFGILDRYDVNLTIATADTELYMVGQWERGDLPDPEQMRFPGGGGTSLEKMTPWVNEQNLRPRFTIYLTDGYLDEWGEKPSFPLLVGILPGGTKRYVPEWAEVIDIIQ